VEHPALRFFFNTLSDVLCEQDSHITTLKMSSQSARRPNRNSVNGTPRSNRNSIDGTPRRRSTRGSEAPLSDALPGSDDQPGSEVGTQAGVGAASQQHTPRGNARSSQNFSQSQAPPTSSPLFFQSTPNGESQSQSQSLGVPDAAGTANGSSPSRQRSDAATPRPSGGFGGKHLGYAMYVERHDSKANMFLQNPHPSTT